MKPTVNTKNKHDENVSELHNIALIVNGNKILKNKILERIKKLVNTSDTSSNKINKTL